MAGSKSNYLENKVLNHLLGSVTYSAPATLYLALFTAAPTDAGGGTEVTGGSYARVAVENNTTNFPTVTNGVKTNGAQITFPQATASWLTVVAVGLFDAATNGNLLYWADLSTSKAVATDDIVVFDIDSLTFTED
ncbi:MAG: hypothetical protein WA117_08410 [Verrucomicrobiia bacterium]